MASARFMLVTGTETDRGLGARWHVLAGGSAADFGWDDLADRGVPGAWVAWRLLGANNRELGRSPRVFADASAARQAMVELVARRAEVVPTVSSSRSTGLWSWRVDLGADGVAVASRTYQRRRDCQYNLTQFQGALPLATLLPLAMLVPLVPAPRRSLSVVR